MSPVERQAFLIMLVNPAEKQKCIGEIRKQVENSSNKLLMHRKWDLLLEEANEKEQLILLEDGIKITRNDGTDVWKKKCLDSIVSWDVLQGINTWIIWILC